MKKKIIILGSTVLLKNFIQIINKDKKFDILLLTANKNYKGF